MVELFLDERRDHFMDQKTQEEFRDLVDVISVMQHWRKAGRFDKNIIATLTDSQVRALVNGAYNRLQTLYSIRDNSRYGDKERRLDPDL